MLQESFEKRTEELLFTIRACIENKILLPGLILLYSGIDIMAWLNMPKSRTEAKTVDFINWVNKYIPLNDINCSAIDLYAARCALLHSYTADSKLSNKGVAKKFFYAWGSSNETNLQKVIDYYGEPIISVHVNKLLLGFITGVERFKQDIANDQKLAERISMRSQKIFTNMPINIVDDFIELVTK